jgi:hypothetical protein
MLSALLDPFSFGVDPSEKQTMATETLRLLLPRMSEERPTPKWSSGAATDTEGRAPTPPHLLTYRA